MNSSGVNISDHREIKRQFVKMNNIYQSLFQTGIITFQSTHVSNSVNYLNIYNEFKKSGIRIDEYTCDTTKYFKFLADHKEKYTASNYTSMYGDYFPQKAFEHWVSAEYLDFQKNDRVLDFAAWISPATEILNYDRPANYYKHDITLKTSLENKTISGYSNAIESDNDYFDYIIAHCAIDNFEQDYDISFFKEAERILKPGGKVLITPLHMAEIFENRIALGSIGADPDDGAFIVLGMPNTLRFGRHYSVKSLQERIINNSSLKFHVVNINNLPMDKYPVTSTNRFILIGEKDK